MFKKTLTALVLMFVMLFGVTGPGVAYSSTIEALSVPVYTTPGQNKQLGAFLLQHAALTGSDLDYSMHLPHALAITDYSISDLNNSFDSVSSAVYDDKELLVHFNNFIATENNAVHIVVNITADIPDDYLGDIQVYVTSPVMGVVTVGRIINFHSEALNIIVNTMIADKRSSDSVSSVWVNLSGLPNGSITGTAYSGAAETPNHFAFGNIKPQPAENINGATDKLKALLSSFENNSQDIVTFPRVGSNTVSGYVYGENRTDVITAYISEIPKCLGIKSTYRGGKGGGGSTTPAQASDDSQESTTSAETPATLDSSPRVTTFALNTNTCFVNGEEMIMDVTPYVKGNRTYVPVRYLTYSLGVVPGDVIWDGDAQQVTITKGDTTIVLTIGSVVMLVNGEPIKMDVAPEITADRTMLPARWVAEALGAVVEWDDTTKEAIIKMPAEEPGD